MKPSLQEYYDDLRKKISSRANHILDRGEFENPHIVISKLYSLEIILTYRNCGLKTANEIFSLVCKLNEYAETIKDQIDLETSIENETNVANSNTDITNKDTEARQKDIDISSFQDSYDRLLSTLSTRTYHIAEKLGFLSIKAFEPYRQSSEKDFLKIKKCGKKSASEFLWLASKLNKDIILKSECTQNEDETRLHIPEIELQSFENEFICYFNEREGHLPMVYLLSRMVRNLLENEECVILKLFYGINYSVLIVPQKDIKNVLVSNTAFYKEGMAIPLSFEEIAFKLRIKPARVKNILKKVSKRLLSNIEINNFCQHPDWRFYGIDKLSSFYIYSKKIEKSVSVENEVLYDFIRNHMKPKDIVRLLKRRPLIGSLIFMLFLQFWGMKPIWISFVKNKLFSSYTTLGHFIPYLAINDCFKTFDFNRVLLDVKRLQNQKTENNIYISIRNYYIDNDDYWSIKSTLTEKEKDALQQLLIEILKLLNNTHFRNDCVYIKANHFDYSSQLYNIIKNNGYRIHRDELYGLIKKECSKKNLFCNLSSSSQITSILTKDPRIVPFGKSGYWGLKEWGENTGSIREIAIQIVKKNKEPILISNLIKKIIDRRPDSKKNSISTVIFQAVGNGELVLFFDDYIGYPKRKYDGEFILMPKTFADWLQEFKKFVNKNRRFPFSNKQGYEGYLYRWYLKASQLTTLLPDEILVFNSNMEELSIYPQDATEYNFLQQCYIFQKFIESNRRMLTKEDDLQLFSWFYSTSRKYNLYKDNRKKYFNELLSQIAKILY